MTDYNYYQMSARERNLYAILAMAALFFISFVFYHNYFLSLLVLPLAFYYPRYRRKQIIAKRKRQLRLQFRDALYSLSSSLGAGKSLESAFRDVRKDLSLLYPDPSTPIMKETEIIIHRLEMNETIESILLDFAQRAHLEDVDSFVDVLIAGKRSGANLLEVIRNTAYILGEKLQMIQEIETILAQRKLEQKALCAMPFVLIILLTWSTGDYMDPVFHTGFGRIVMTFAIILLFLSIMLTKRIMDIEV